MVVDQLPRLGKRELICLQLFTCKYVVSVWRGFLFFWVRGMDYVILLCHSLSLPYNYFETPTETYNKKRISFVLSNAKITIEHCVAWETKVTATTMFIYYTICNIKIYRVPWLR